MTVALTYIKFCTKIGFHKMQCTGVYVRVTLRFNFAGVEHLASAFPNVFSVQCFFSKLKATQYSAFLVKNAKLTLYMSKKIRWGVKSQGMVVLPCI